MARTWKDTKKYKRMIAKMHNKFMFWEKAGVKKWSRRQAWKKARRMQLETNWRYLKLASRKLKGPIDPWWY